MNKTPMCSTVIMSTFTIKPMAAQVLDIITKHRYEADSAMVADYIEKYSKPYRKWFRMVQRTITVEEADYVLRKFHGWSYPCDFGHRAKTIAQDLVVACESELTSIQITVPVRDLAILTTFIKGT